MAEQKVKTKEYWDKFYMTNPTSIGDSKSTNVSNKLLDGDGDKGSNCTSSDLEWIVPNAPHLLDKIFDLFPPSPSKEEGYDNTINVLEIGCGVSQLSKSLLQRILHNQEPVPSVHHLHQQCYNFVSTDISSVCIDHNRIRDDVFISSLHAENDGSSRLSYEVLDVLNETTCISHAKKQYNVILDKGTLDTFLFRSKRTKKGSSSHPPILTVLLNNIHRLLSSDGIYLIISPRSKIRSLRDFQGFTSVRRITVDVTTFDDNVVLVKGNSENAKQQSKSEVYLYQCIKNDKYSPGKDESYNTNNWECKAEDCSTCSKCGMSFKEFRGKVKVKDQGEVVWKRRFNNHIVHCKGIAEG